MAELGDFHVTIRADVVTRKCQHGIERGQCLSVECVKHTDIPIRGEKSWDSRLQLQNGGSYQSQFRSFYQNQFLPSIRWTYQMAAPSFQFTNPSPSRSEPTAETRDLPVIGYRGWRVREAPSAARSIGPRVAAHQVAGKPTVELVSVNQHFGPWDRNGVTRAVCHASPGHKAPSFNCECGLYVLSSLATAPKWYGENGVPQDVVIGAVVGWGEVIQHGDEGWRAEFARPVAFLKTDLFYDQPLLYRAAEQYGIPVIERRGLELYAKEYGGGLLNEF